MRRGFTIIEILIVIAIMAVIATIVFFSFSAIKSSQSLDKDADMVVEVLRQARSQTLVSQNNTTYGVHFASTTVTLFAGSAYSATDSSNVANPLLGSDTVLTVTLNGGGSDVVFQRLSGESSQNGTIVLSSRSSSKTRTITIYKTGLIEYQ